MELGNYSTVILFILAGLSEQTELQLSLFLLFLQFYVLTMVGNLSMITLILLSSQLYTHIYFLLSNMSFIHLCHSTIITPKMLVNFLNFLTNKNVILYPECMIQLIFSLFAIEECHMLAIMAYDCCVANCTPLHYLIMSHHLCLGLIVVVCTLGFIRSSIHRSLMLKILLCKTKVFTQYFCDLFPLLELSSSKICINEFPVLFLSSLSSLTPTLTILTSYIFIIASILYIKSTEGKFKTFSTFSSHTLLFPSYLVQLHSCIQPSSVSSMNQEKLSFVLYTTIMHMLKPMIYSLRNKDVKSTLKKIHEQNHCCVIK